VATLKRRVALEGPAGKIFAFSPDGSQIAGLGGDFTLWDSATGKARRLESPPLPTLAQPVTWQGQFSPSSMFGQTAAVAAAFSDDASLLFVEYHPNPVDQLGHRCTVQVWDLTKGATLKVRNGYDDKFGALCSIDKESNQYNLLKARGAPMPGSALLLNRFRILPVDRMLVLPRYDALPYTVFCGPMGSFELVVAPRLKESPTEPDPPKRVLWQFKEVRFSANRSCILSRDGKWLMAVGYVPKQAGGKQDASALYVWDVSQFRTAAMVKIPAPTATDLEYYWVSLAKIEAIHLPLAHRAMRALQAYPEKTVPFLARAFGKPADLKKVARWIEDLDDPKYAVRERAYSELERQSREVIPSLEKALAGKNSRERAYRLEKLLGWHRAKGGYDPLRALRAIDVLEHCNTPAARELLRALAAGEYGPEYARVAQEALKRAG
jgi:hypothetical protein